MLTLLPPTFARPSKSGSKNGSNGPFHAWYWRDHPFAAGIAAQEVREARFKMPFALGGMALIAGVIVLAGLPLALLPLAAAGLLVVRLPAIKRRLELKGQAVECVVRLQFYGTPFKTTVAEAAAQLSRYGQFKDWSVSKLTYELTRELTAAQDWVADNRKLIARAYRAGSGV